MGRVADAGRDWEGAAKESDKAEATGNVKEKVIAKKKLQDAFDAYQRALKDQQTTEDDVDDTTYRRKAFGADPIVEAETEVGGSGGIKPSSGSGKGSI